MTRPLGPLAPVPNEAATASLEVQELGQTLGMDLTQASGLGVWALNPAVGKSSSIRGPQLGLLTPMLRTSDGKDIGTHAVTSSL